MLLLVGQVRQVEAQILDILPGNLQVRLDRIAQGLSSNVGSTPQITPIDYSVIPDGSGRALVATLGGVLRLVEKDGTLHNAALDLTTDPIAQAKVATTGEWGFHSVAVHPGYNDPNSPGYQKFYTISSRSVQDNATFDDNVSSNHNSVVLEWTVTQLDEGNLTATSRKILDANRPGQAHSLYDLAFDATGLLYISSGDGGANNNLNGNQNGRNAAQDPRNIFGTLLRIDPTNPTNPHSNLSGKTISANGAYSIPNSNHFAADGIGNTPAEIVTLGVRSPWRMNFDSATGDLYVGNVGGTQRESIFRFANGANGDNAGWGRFEGSLQNGNVSLAAGTTHTLPVLEYDHNDGVCIVGGFVYRGSALPELWGKYVFGDLGEESPTGSARLFYGIIDPLATDFGQIYEFEIDALGEQLPLRLLSIGQDADGELLLLAGIDPRTNGAGEFGLEGVILKLVPVPEPQAIFLATATMGWVGLVALRRRKAYRRKHQ